METFNWRIPRSLASKLGEEAVAIIDAGRYESPSGGKVDIAALIESSRAGTESFPPDRSTPAVRQGTSDTVIEIENETTLAAGHRLLRSGLNPVVLNFASAIHPGGGFLSGARAQEEYLARSSGLYACLVGNPMYAFHRERYDPLYSDYVIYSPGVPVFRDDSGALLEDPYSIGIITSPAVNAAELPVSRTEEIEGAMRGRIRKVLSVGHLHGHNAIVLGAWGCGAFGNDYRSMATLFKECFEADFSGSYERIVFAIVDTWEDQRTIGPFREVFGDLEH